ncbi:uncharacterized protein LOC115008145 isoform X2 [Cottoperca gobio]|uniref:Uncharacterized protein LOC115008145 isoform X2 n=1 Tax=Cottoperca gobio TaxID=56716 RepID=A0A6J2PQJ1_COTGO|nr:uncharacterized protein LOC115008145 isoform X2 [Cottoperca gobio]
MVYGAGMRKLQKEERGANKSDDYIRDMQSEIMGGTIKKLLKTSAVPSVFISDTGRGEGEPRIAIEEQTTCTSTATVPSCGTETRHVMVAAAAHSQGGLGPELHDTWAVMDRPPGQVRSIGIQVNVPETCTAATENRPALQHMVDEEAILQLMKDCPMCDRKCRCSKYTRGPYFIVYQSCYFCNYQRKWANQPEARNINFHKANTAPKRKRQPKDKVSVNAKAQSSQLKTSISESSVS